MYKPECSIYITHKCIHMHIYTAYADGCVLTKAMWQKKNGMSVFFFCSTIQPLSTFILSR